MAKMIERAAFDAGPLIHLREIGAFHLLALFRRISITPGVRDEIQGVQLPSHCEILQLAGEAKDFAKIVSERYDIALGEASAIAIAKQEHIRLFFTDDLQARDAARRVGLEPHGTLAILTRALREKIIGREEAISLLERLHAHSSLYLTSDLVDWARKRITEEK